MRFLRSFLLLGLPVLSLGGRRNSAERVDDDDILSLEEVVRWIPEESVRAALRDNLAGKYRDGVFEHGRKAIEAVRNVNPQLATRLVDEALHRELERVELKKRQNNDTTTSPPDRTSSPPDQSSSTDGDSQPTNTGSDDRSSTNQGGGDQTSSSTDQGGGGQPSSTEGGGNQPTDTNTGGGNQPTDTNTGGGNQPTDTNTGGGNQPTNTNTGGGNQPSSNQGGGGQPTNTGGGGGTPTSTPGGGNTETGNTGGGGNTQGGGSTGEGSTQTGVIVPVTLTSTDDDGSTVERTTSVFQSTAETSTVVEVTTTNGQGERVTRSETVPAVVVTTTNGQGETVTRASPVSTVRVAPGGSIVNNGGNENSDDAGSYTTTDNFGNSVVLSGTRAGQVITTTDAKGRTVVLTYTPGGGEVSELVVKTTQLPNGRQSTITSFAVVGGPSRAGQAENTRPPPGLQTNLAAPTGRYLGEMAALFGGAAGIAAFL